MTSQSPRVYTYKITFEEVPYYYYGVKKEKYFNQEYWGSPITNKWCWELYTPKKQILELFEYSDEGYIEAQEVEKRIIAPVLNDKWCLNENVGGIISLKNFKKMQEKQIGIFSLTKEQLSENGKKTYELGIGVHGRTKEQMTKDGIAGGNKVKELGIGIHAQTPEERSKYGKMGALKCKENRTGIYSIPVDVMTERNYKNSLQRWICLETGFITNAGALTKYQKARGIYTSKRKRIS